MDVGVLVLGVLEAAGNLLVGGAWAGVGCLPVLVLCVCVGAGVPCLSRCWVHASAGVGWLWLLGTCKVLGAGVLAGVWVLGVWFGVSVSVCVGGLWVPVWGRVCAQGRGCWCVGTHLVSVPGGFTTGARRHGKRWC